MKTSYEIAMERLKRTDPGVALTTAQKKALAELDSKYQAKIAEREIFLKGELAKAIGQGDETAVEQLEKQLASDRRTLEVEREEKKEAIRQGAG